MIQQNGPAALLWYVYRAISQGDEGFSITVYENDTLVFTLFGPMRQVVQQLTFPLPPMVQDTILRLMDTVAAWPTSMPERVPCGHSPAYACMVGMAGRPMVVVDELAEQAALPFANRAGHWARRIFLLMEDVSELLASCGFYLEPNRFQWDDQNVFPM